MRALFRKHHASILAAALGGALGTVAAMAVSVQVMQDLNFGAGSANDPALAVPAGPAGAIVEVTSKKANSKITVTGMPASETMKSGKNSITVGSFVTSTDAPSFNTGPTGKTNLYLGATRSALGATLGAGNYTGRVQFNVNDTSDGSTTKARVNLLQTVLASISVSTVSQLAFGTGAAGDGPVAVAPSSSNAASFLVSGAGNQAFSIVLPSNGTVTLSGPGGATIAVSAFLSTPSGSGVLSAGGTATVSVGATRAALPANQTPGNYTGTFLLTVRY